MTENNRQYRGRFAPSPTGPLHFGTLIAAVGSYLSARSRNGEWLLRIENVDTLREVAGAADDCLRTLEQFGFEWDGEVVYQTQRTEYYQQALDELQHKNLVYPCTCSRKQLLDAVSEENDASIYPGFCIDKTLPWPEEHSIRVRTQDISIAFNDAVAGPFTQNLKSQCGDFIIKRRDGLFAYQLAVVLDDALQGITEVVRGRDLLESTPRQIYLQQLLDYRRPDYAHLPLAVDAENRKLSKSHGAAGLDASNPVPDLFRTLVLLEQHPPEALKQATVDELWQWAIENWNINKVPAQNKTVV